MSFLKFLISTGRAENKAVAQNVIDEAASISTGAGQTSAQQPVYYPSDLFTVGNESHIIFIKRDATKNGELSNDRTANRIALYMPPAIKVNYGANWEDIQLKYLQYKDLAQEVGGAVVEGTEGNFGRIGNLLGRAGANALDFVTGTGLNAAGQYEEYFKRTINPRMAQLFKNTEFRTFGFDFQLMARNKNESEAIQKIITSFKAGMHPDIESSDSGRYWKYPDLFDIYLSTDDQKTGNKYLFQIKTAALTNMTVDYAGSGIPSFFNESGAPVDIRMGLQFKELSILTKKDVIDGF